MPTNISKSKNFSCRLSAELYQLVTMLILLLLGTSSAMAAASLNLPAAEQIAGQTSGNRVRVYFSVDASEFSSTNWIGIYLGEIPSGSSIYNHHDYQYAGTLSGVRDFSLPNNYTGKVSVVYFYNGGYSRVLAQSQYSYQGSTNTNSSAVSFIVSGKTLSIARTSSKTTPTDWIGIFNKGQAGNYRGYIAWGYVPSNGSALSLNTLSNGSYEAYLFSENGYGVIGTSGEFTIGGSTGNVSAGHSVKSSKVSGTQVNFDATVSASAVSATNWVGLYDWNETSPQKYLAWSYVKTSSVSGTLNAPSTGRFKLRLFSNNGYDEMASSGVIEVSSSIPPTVVPPTPTTASPTITCPMFIYSSPDASAQGVGTRSSPVDIETALTMAQTAINQLKCDTTVYLMQGVFTLKQPLYIPPMAGSGPNARLTITRDPLATSAILSGGPSFREESNCQIGSRGDGQRTPGCWKDVIINTMDGQKWVKRYTFNAGRASWISERIAIAKSRNTNGGKFLANSLTMNGEPLRWATFKDFPTSVNLVGYNPPGSNPSNPLIDQQTNRLRVSLGDFPRAKIEEALASGKVNFGFTALFSYHIARVKSWTPVSTNYLDIDLDMPLPKESYLGNEVIGTYAGYSEKGQFMNSPLFLSPGEFFYNEDDQSLYVFPLPNTDVHSGQFSMGLLHNLIVLDGKPGSGSIMATDLNPVSYVTISDIGFANTAWKHSSPVSDGSETFSSFGQGEYGEDGGAILGRRVHEIKLNLLDFRAVGAGVVLGGGSANDYGHNLDGRATNITVSNSRFKYIAGVPLVTSSGVMVGNKPLRRGGNQAGTIPDSIALSSTAEIVGNTITYAGMVKLGAPGIALIRTFHARIADNLIAFTPWAGITSGMRWQQHPSFRIDIVRNQLYNVMTHTADSGGIILTTPGQYVAYNTIVLGRSAYGSGFDSGLLIFGPRMSVPGGLDENRAPFLNISTITAKSDLGVAAIKADAFGCYISAEYNSVEAISMDGSNLIARNGVGSQPVWACGNDVLRNGIHKCCSLSSVSDQDIANGTVDCPPTWFAAEKARMNAAGGYSSFQEKDRTCRWIS